MVDAPRNGRRAGVYAGTLTEVSKVVFFGLLCGATSLIPLPFLDDWIFDIVRRFMARELMADSGYRLTSTQVRLLTRRPPRWQEQGCLPSLGYYLLVAPIRMSVYVARKLFRKIVFILTVKEASDRSLEAFHEGYLLSLGAKSARTAPEMVDDDFLEGLRETVRKTLEHTDTSALSQVFRTVVQVNRTTLSRAGALLLSTWNRLRGKPPVEAEEVAAGTIRAEENLLGEITREATEKILGQSGYLDELENKFLRRFEHTNRRSPVTIA